MKGNTFTYLYKTMLKIFSYIPRLSSEIGMIVEYLFFNKIPFLNQHFTCFTCWGSVSRAATAAKTNVAHGSAVGFFFHHCNRLI